MVRMKLYRREIRPYMFVPGCQGWSDTHETLIVDGKEWHPEADEDRLRRILESEVKKKDPWGTLKFDERYVYHTDYLTLDLTDRITTDVNCLNIVNHRDK